MDKGKISVIMAVFNCADTIHQSIESIISQTYDNWEFIICDDCSTDNTLEIVREYEAKYPNKFKIIQNEKNSRLAFSLNHCLEYVNGEFVARMDGDDYVAPDRFEKQISFLMEHPDIHLVGSAMQSFDNNKLGRIITYKPFPEKEDLRKGPCFAHASILTYAYTYKETGGYTVSARTMRTQDYDLWFRFYAKGFKGANLDDPLYYYREDEYAYLRRKPKLYLWAVVTRFKGFRLLKFPLHYYVYTLTPIVGLVYNEMRKLKAKFTLKRKSK
ncbi:MAG: glycosyltransferase [Clostridia bacterium]|nr:glycosyltransferase [Clostridia bacterium]